MLVLAGHFRHWLRRVCRKARRCSEHRVTEARSTDEGEGFAFGHSPARRPADYDNGIDPKGGYPNGDSSGAEVAKDDIPCFDSAEALESATTAVANQDAGGFAAEMATHGTHIAKGQRFDVVERKTPIEHIRARLASASRSGESAVQCQRTLRNVSRNWQKCQDLV